LFKAKESWVGLLCRTDKQQRRLNFNATKLREKKKKGTIYENIKLLRTELSDHTYFD
jgi:regulator of sirC expression with transglutaminase-like and TPR domain